MLTKRRTIKRQPHIKGRISAPSFMDRRTFLKQSGLAASAAALASGVPLARVPAAEANTGTPADALVQKWIAINDPNVYLEQTVTASKPILRDGDFSDSEIEGDVFMKMKHSYFNNKKYIYFQPSGTSASPVIQYFKLHNATADASNVGDIKVN